MSLGRAILDRVNLVCDKVFGDTELSNVTQSNLKQALVQLHVRAWKWLDHALLLKQVSLVLQEAGQEAL